MSNPIYDDSIVLPAQKVDVRPPRTGSAAINRVEDTDINTMLNFLAGAKSAIRGGDFYDLTNNPAAGVSAAGHVRFRSNAGILEVSLNGGAYQQVATLAGSVTSQLYENILPNTRWQIATAIPSAAKMNYQGTGALGAITVTSYTTGANTVVALTANTGQLKVGDLVFFQAPASANMRISACRVEAVVTNVSFTVKLPLNLTGTSAACTAVPWDIGGSASIGVGDAFDGWTKDAGATVWREDNAVNLKTGSKYACGYMKSSSSTQYLYHAVPARNLSEYLGRTMVFGAWVNQKVRGGTGTWRAFINTNGSGGGYTFSTPSSAAANAYDWKEIAAAVPTDSTQLFLGIAFDGNSADSYYISQPIAGRGPFIGQGNYIAPRNEVLYPRVKLSPLTFTNASPTFPSTPGSAGDFGFVVRPGAETNGAIAPTTQGIRLTLEGRCNSLNDDFATRNQEAVPHVYAQVLSSKVVGAKEPGFSDVTLDANGDFFMYTGIVTLTGTVTFTNGSATVTGTSTKFVTELSNGMLVRPSGTTDWYIVSARASDVSMTLTVVFGGSTATDVAGDKTKSAWFNVSIDYNGYEL